MNVRKISFLFLALLLCISIGLNWNHNEKKESNTAKILGEAAYVHQDVKIEENSLENQKIECEASREKALALLEEVLKDPTADAERINEAQSEKIAIAKSIEAEALIEAQIKNKGLGEAVAFITGKQAVIYVSDTNVDTSEIIQIQEIASSTSGISPEKIKISLIG